MENICWLKVIATDFPMIFTNSSTMHILYFAQDLLDALGHIPVSEVSP